MTVPVKDRKFEVEYLRMGLAMSEVGVSYETADLIYQIANDPKVKSGKFDMKDGVNTFYQWQIKWYR